MAIILDPKHNTEAFVSHLRNYYGHSQQEEVFQPFSHLSMHSLELL